MSAPKRTLQIESFNRRFVGDLDWAEKTCKMLEQVIHKIFNHNANGLSFEELYRGAYQLVVYKYGEKLYSGFVTTTTFHLTEIRKSIEAANGNLFLEELNRKWADHNKALQFIKDILMYMDRTFVPCTHKTPVVKLGLNLWRDVVIHSNNIQTRLPHTLLELVQRERSGEVINRDLLGSITKMLMILGPLVYQDDFEKHFMEGSAVFYRLESQKYIESCCCGEYLRKAESRLTEEIMRVNHSLDARSKAKITNVVVKEMIESHMERLVHMENSGLVHMLEVNKYADLGRMYCLFRRVTNGLTLVRDAMTSYVRDTGKQLVSDPERLKNPIDLIQLLLDLKDKYDKIISTAFNNDKTFQNALNSSFEYFINLDFRTPEFVSMFVDDKLWKGLGGVSKENVEEVLDKVMRLFRYLKEKYVFEKYYRKHLAKRLLSGKRVSDDAERSLIDKFKTVCGDQFTSKLEGMLTDMKISQDTLRRFYLKQGIESVNYPLLTVQVLIGDFWPMKPSATCNLPSEILGICEKLQSYYIERGFRGRFCWQTNMGTADLKATFGRGQTYELNVSTHQMCVLMLFNNADRLSYKEIELATKIAAPDLKRCLQSLTCVKGLNVLRKEPISKDIAKADSFLVNDKFTSKCVKVKIATVVAQTDCEQENQEFMIGSLVAQRESEAENLKTRWNVENDWKPQIEAAIVRIMKASRVLDHNNLVAEVTKELQSRFLPNLVVIKNGIESLIERKFLERDEVDWTLYRYIP